MSKRSDPMTKGPERAPHRSLLRAEGFTDWEMVRPMIGIANSFNEIIPGHMHLDKLVDAVKEGDTINIDIPDNRLDVQLSEADVGKRLG